MTKRLVTILLVTMFLVGVGVRPARAQDNQATRITLAGIDAVYVVVDGAPASFTLLGLTKEAIQADIELKLRLAGLRVVTPEAGIKIPGRPSLFVYIGWELKPGGGGAKPGAGMMVALKQDVLLTRNSLPVFDQITWRIEYDLETNAQYLRDELKEGVDQFLNAWLYVNPKKSGTSKDHP